MRRLTTAAAVGAVVMLATGPVAMADPGDEAPPGEESTTTLPVDTTTTTTTIETTTTVDTTTTTTTITVEVGDEPSSEIPSGETDPPAAPSGSGVPTGTDALPAPSDASGGGSSDPGPTSGLLAATGSSDDVGTTSALVSTTVNANQVNQEQDAIVEATVVANADTGGNVIVDDTGPVGSVSVPAKIDTGAAAAVGSSDVNVVSQGADVVLADQAQANVVQVALILNIGLAFANSGLNVVGAAPGGGGSGAIGTGDATATGLEIGQYITQGARASGDEDTDTHTDQSAISVWIGVATANSGANTVNGSGGAGSGGAVGTGDASATGNDSLTDVEQYAAIFGTGTSVTNVTQNATVLNIGFAVANSGLNDIADVAGGLLTSDRADDDGLATELFAMLLPAMLQSYGYGPGSGTIATGDAAAVGNRSDTFVRQVAMAASSGDGVVDIVQNVLVANVGAAAANTGVNSLGSGDVRLLDNDTANAVVTMAAFMSELLAMAHRSAGSANLQAQRSGVTIPFQGLLLQLDGSFEGLDTTMGTGDGAQANVRQISIVLSLGFANANSGGNQTSTITNQGNSVNGLAAGDALAVMALDGDGNVIGTGDAAASNRDVVTICQRINADDVTCLAPPTTTIPAVTTVPGTTTPGPPTSVSPNTLTTVPPGGTATTLPGTPGTLPPATTQPPHGFVPQGTLPMTGAETTVPALVGGFLLLLGSVCLVSTRKRVP